MNWWLPGRQHCGQEQLTVITEGTGIPRGREVDTHTSLPQSGLTRLGAEQAAGLQMSLYSCPSPPSRKLGKHNRTGTMRAWGLWYGQGLVNGTCDLPVVGSAELCEDLIGGC